MSTPHKHAAIIKAWADGAEIEFRIPGSTNGWIDTAGKPPLWLDSHEYRVKVVPKWPVERAAYAAGKKVQFRQCCTRVTLPPWQEADRCPWRDWNIPTPPNWDTSDWLEFRIKPERIELFLFASPQGVGIAGVMANIKLVFDGEKLELATIL